MYFDNIIDFTLKWEGGDSDHPSDVGGRTRFGIAQRYHPEVDVSTLTEEQAIEIYKSKYWHAAGCDVIAEADPVAAWMVFDAAVNIGVTRAKKLLQKAVHVQADGQIGRITLRAIRERETSSIIVNMSTQRILFYVTRPTFKTFGKGWLRRTVDLCRHVSAEVTEL